MKRSFTQVHFPSASLSKINSPAASGRAALQELVDG
jgi:hypothetical protein